MNTQALIEVIAEQRNAALDQLAIAKAEIAQLRIELESARSDFTSAKDNHLVCGQTTNHMGDIA